MILYYCIQPIDGDTDIVNQANPFIPDWSYRSESYLHRAHRYILKTKQLGAESLKNGPFKQVARLFHKLFHTKELQNYEFCWTSYVTNNLLMYQTSSW